MTLKKISFFLLLFIALSFALNGQDDQQKDQVNPEARQYYYKANKYQTQRAYKKVATLAKKAIKADSSFKEAYMLLGTAFNKRNKLKKEKAVYQNLIKKQPEYPGSYYNLGKVQMQLKNYDKAKQKFQKFVNFPDAPDKYKDYAEKNIKKSKFRLEAMKDSLPYDPKNAGGNINTSAGEYWPVLTADAQTLFFTRKIIEDSTSLGMKRFNEDIFYSKKKQDGTWQKAKHAEGRINSKNYNEGAITISPDGNYILFTGCQWPDGLGRCDIYLSKYKNGTWTEPKNLGGPVNSSAKETQPSISYDGRTLYFASDRKGTSGKLDIWKSKRKPNGEWGAPENLRVINTSGVDQSPFIHPDNHTLYFSSKKRLGMGGTDLFYTKKDTVTGKFKEPKNLGYPINTQDDEISIFITADATTAFVASKMEGGYGNYDIYHFKLPEKIRPKPITYLKGKVYNAVTKEPLKADFELLNLETNELAVKSHSAAKSGQFLVPVQSDHNYALNVNKKGYMFFSDHLPVKSYDSTKPYIRDIPLQPIEKGKKVVLRNIFFELDSYKLKGKSKTELQKLVKFMNNNPEVNIEIGGYTDYQGSKNYNQELSKKRAKEVYHYLINKGSIKADRLTYKGYGEKDPIESNETEEGRAANRRTEFKVIGTGKKP